METDYSPQKLLSELKGKKVEVLPSFNEGFEPIACCLCDCSGCNNASVMIDFFDEDKAK